jgi:N-acyl-D-aspartate/D-glutamate deacylase
MVFLKMPFIWLYWPVMNRPFAFFLFALVSCRAQSFDLVVRGGRVLDPESGIDAVRHVGVTAGRIAAVSASPLTGRTVIDAAGLTVTPGFIDLHAHGQDDENHRYQALDGVTTALELELGTADVDRWYASRAPGQLVNYGVTVGHVPNRMQVMKDPNPGLVPSGDGANRAATEEEIGALKARLEKGLKAGALGAGFGIQYTPAASRWEILEMFRIAGRYRVPAFVHIRHMGGGEPASALNALEEVIALSAVSGAPVHVVHITSSGLRQTPQLLQTIGEARARGMDITTECYPYNAAMTELQSAIFAEGWQNVLGVSYGEIEWVATGERLSAATFAPFRKAGGMVIMHMIPDSIVAAAMANPFTMIASDGVLEHGKGHPRAAGTFTRALGFYARNAGALTLMDAVRKMTLMPAERLKLGGKGRIKPGADADLAIFDAARVIDRATFREPTLPPEGMRHVLVGGVAVVRDGKIVENARPGRSVRRTP